MQFVRTAAQAQDNLFTVNHVPAVNTQATKNQAAAGAGLKNVCTSISATISADATAPAAVQLYVYLRDGTTGSGTILQAWTVSLPAHSGSWYWHHPQQPMDSRHSEYLNDAGIFCCWWGAYL